MTVSEQLVKASAQISLAFKKWNHLKCIHAPACKEIAYISLVNHFH